MTTETFVVIFAVLKFAGLIACNVIIFRLIRDTTKSLREIRKDLKYLNRNIVPNHPEMFSSFR